MFCFSGLEQRMGIAYINRGCTSNVIGDAGVPKELSPEIVSRLGKARERLVASHDDQSLGFMTCIDAPVESFLDQARTAHKEFKDQVVIGIGGSSLGARAILESWGEEANLRTHFSENIDPESFFHLLESLDLSSALFVVITKSGTTVETMAKFWIAWERVVAELGENTAARNFIAITDPERGSLRPITNAFGFETFSVPPNVGGRFSVLTSVGLLPLANAGYPIENLLTGARKARDTFLEQPIELNSIARSAADHVELMDLGYSQTVMMVYADRLVGLSEWFAQLWGESLGKATDREGKTVNTGLTPIRALGVVDQHSQIQLYAQGPRDKHVMFVETKTFNHDVAVPKGDAFPSELRHLQGKTLAEILKAEAIGTRKALEKGRRPTTRWTFDSIAPEEVGMFIMSWEIITALVGELLNINAFDQPGVELGKKIAHGLLGRKGFEEWANMARE